MDSILNQPQPRVQVAHEVKTALVDNADPYPLPKDRKFQYGTAGVSHMSSFILNNNSCTVLSYVI